VGPTGPATAGPDSSFQPRQPPGSGLYTWTGTGRSGPGRWQPAQVAGAELGRMSDRLAATPGSRATVAAAGLNEYAARSAP
jgi:hypothetical protein